MSNTQKHVMHVIDSLAIGGAERMLVDIANSTDQTRFVPSVCITRHDDAMAKHLKPDIPVCTLDRKWSFDPAGFIRLKHYSEEQQVDIFHAHGRSTYSFLLAAHMLGIVHQPIILHDHFGNIDIDESVPIWFKSIATRQIDYYVGVCEKLANWAIKAGVPTHRVTCIGNTLDINRYAGISAFDIHKLLSVPTGKKVALMVANIRLAKGLDILIDVCKNIPRECLPVFVLIGKTADQEYYQQCIKEIQINDLQDHFRFVGQKADPIAWMKSADFAVMSSRSESGPLVLIEFMASGLPFVSFKVGGISQMISTQLPDWFAPPGDIREFAEKLLMMLNLKETERTERQGMERKLAAELFDIHNTMNTWYEIYRYVENENL